MRIKVLTTCDNPNHEGYLRLKESLDKFGYDYECIVHPFSFGHQLPVVLNWCKNYTGDATHILYTDAYDTMAFAGVDEVLQKFSGKMLISCEKSCYPHPERAKDYPETPTMWKYVNGGGWLVEIEYFKQLCQKENLNADSHDQVWLMDAYLNNKEDIQLDNNCEIFQTIAFSYPEEWEEHNGRRFFNKGTGTFPIFFHGNGHTDMSWLK